MIWLIILTAINYIAMFIGLYKWVEESFVSSLKFMAVAIAAAVVALFIPIGDEELYFGIWYFALGILIALIGLIIMFTGAFARGGKFIAVGLISLIIGLFGFGLFFDFTGGGSGTDYEYDYDSDYSSTYDNDDYDYDYDYGDGEKYDPDDDLYSDHDYNSDGYINQNEWEDALGDYMDSIMGY